MIELALAGRAPVRRSASSAREELPCAESALTPLLEREPACGRPSWRCDGADRQRDARRLPGQHQRHVDLPRRQPATRRGRGWPTTRSSARRRAIAALAAARPPEPHEFDGLEFFEVASVTRIAGGIARNVIPDRVDRATSTTATPPAARRRRPRRGCVRCATAHGELEIDANAPSGAVPDGNPLVQRLDRRRRRCAVAPKQAWTPVAEFALAGVDAVNFGPGDPRAGAPPRRVGRASTRSCAATASLEAVPVRLNPTLEALRVVPVRAADAGQERAPRRAASRSSTSASASRARRRRRSSAPRSRTRSSRCRRTRLPRGCRSCARRSPPGPRRRFGAALDPDTEIVPTLGSKEAIFHLAQVIGPGKSSR